jgi:hypothetical protein
MKMLTGALEAAVECNWQFLEGEVDVLDAPGLMR